MTTASLAHGSSSGPDSHPGRRASKRIGVVVGALVVLLLVAVAAVYAWPVRSDQLTHATAQTLSFQDSVARADAAVDKDVADPTVRPECRSQALIHPRRAAKAVLLLHGYTACPAQFGELAQLFYAQGYNVYLPRAPKHGLLDVRAHAGVRAGELVDYADDALTTTSGLGDEVGVVGLSGGGVLATWLAEYRTDLVSRLLVLSPFFQPAASQAPAFVIKPLIVLYGNHVLPDHFNAAGQSFAALSQYLRIGRNLRDDPESRKLLSVAVVTSAADTSIDLKRAQKIPQEIGRENRLDVNSLTIPAEWQVPHDIVTPDKLGAHRSDLEQTYLSFYEGRPA